MPITSYRYPSETPIFYTTVLVVLAVFALTAGVTACLAPVLIIASLLVAYYSSQSRHQALKQRAMRVSPEQTPVLNSVTESCMRALNVPPGEVDFFVAGSRVRNAYTFGLSKPNIIVIFSSLVETMRPEELRFIIGHELGHVALGHAWLNSLLGGMAGIPTTLGGALALTLAFRWWNRACEYSCDRAGLLACGSLRAAELALVKLVASEVRSEADLQRALAVIEQEDDSPLNVLAESLATHPMIVRRLEQLRAYAASSEYQRLKSGISSY